MAQFKVGDAVRLKSGGPVMTVVTIGKNDDGTQKVWTNWFDKSGKQQNGFYQNADALQADTGPGFA